MSKTTTTKTMEYYPRWYSSGNW